jgi:RNA polymerase sigma-70 factor, ECF subfamily
MESYLMDESQPDPETGDLWLKWCHEALEGNRDAKDMLFGELRPFFNAIALKHSWRRDRGSTDTSDVAQINCMKVLDSLHQFKGKTGAEFIAWLRTIARSGRLDEVRKGNALMRGGGLLIGAMPTDSNGELAIAADTSTPSKELTRQENYRQFLETLGQLSSDYQEVIRLRRLSPVKLSWAEIAQQLNRSEGAAKLLYHRAIKELKRLSEESGDDS